MRACVWIVRQRMQKVNNLQGRSRNVVLLLIALLIVVADQLIKIWIRSNLAVGQSMPDTGFFQITHVNNSGAAFGLFQGQTFALTVFASVIIVGLLLYVFFISRRVHFLENMLGRTGLGLVLGGAAGNLIDRVRFGYVTDFIDVGLWPAFNIADSAVTVGVIIFAGSLLYSARAEER